MSNETKTKNGRVSTRSQKAMTPPQAKAHQTKHSRTVSDHSQGDCDQSMSDHETISDQLKELIERTVQHEIQALSTSLNMASDENTELRKSITSLENRLKLTEGLLLRAEKKLMMQNEKIIDLQARSMRENLVIQGIKEDDDETWAKTQEKVVGFMKNNLKITGANKNMIERAHRVGQKNSRKPRQIVAKLTSSSTKDLIFRNVRNLAGQSQFSIQEQFPPEIQESRKRLWHLFKEAKEKKKTDKSVKINWSLDKLYINGKQHTARDDLQHIDPREHLKHKFRLEHSKSISEQGSTFQGHAAKLTPDVPAAAVLAKLYSIRNIAKADHNIYACRVKQGNSIRELCSDDGEHGASNHLLRLLQEKELENVIVVCTRWFGGTHIGPNRFNHIKDCTKEALQKLTTTS